MEIGSINVVLMREQSTAEEINNIIIVAPYSFRNALPCDVYFRKVNNETRYMLRVIIIINHEYRLEKRNIFTKQVAELHCPLKLNCKIILVLSSFSILKTEYEMLLYNYVRLQNIK